MCALARAADDREGEDVTSAPENPFDEALRLLLDCWVPAQRWFGNKGTSGELILGGSVDLGQADERDAADSTAQLRVVSAVTTRGEVTTYQVPLVFYPDEAAGQDAGLVGVLD